MTSRRNFLKQSLLGATGSLLVPTFLKAFENPNAFMETHDKILVVVQLSGGNDGLNTIVPYRNDLYYQHRPSLAIAAGKVLKVSDELGFHPALAPLQGLYDRGYLGVFNNVGYPNPDRSHFRSMDIWQTASPERYLQTGWIGRYLDANCPGCSVADQADQAIELDDTLSLALKGDTIKGLAMKDPRKLYNAVHHSFIHEVAQNNTAAGVNDPSLHYLYKTLAETVSSADFLYQKAGAPSSGPDYPQSDFSKKLKTVAQLIHARVPTRVYYVSMAGFDTHVNQQAQHQRLLQLYSEGITAFVEDLEKSDRMKDVLIMTFSEFGRRVAQNASGGTDHGTANNLFVLTKHLKQKGFLNNTPDLLKLDNGDLIHQLDFRSVYATILDRWLEVEPKKILSDAYPTLDFI